MEYKQGDIILFSGKTETHRKAQKYISNKWSQVGILINWNGKLAIFESTKVPVCNEIESREFVSGVQVVLLSEKVSVFDGEIAIRILTPHLNCQQEEKLLEFVTLNRGKPFNDSKYFMARAKERRNTQNDNSKYFCSQLVAQTLQNIGILQKPPLGTSSGNYSPADFPVNQKHSL